MFQPVPAKPDLPELEERILKFWRERNIFQKSLEQRQGAPLFVFYEGPPTANASPGVHHALSRVFKDIFPRYKAMKGYYTPRKAGWDCHGLPVELEVEQELGFATKMDIESYGVGRFNDHCRQSVLGYIKEWEQLTERIGFWLDMERPYITMDNDYIESCWWIVKRLWDKGLIYQGYKVTPHCPRCGTSLSSHEVALGYKEVDDPSIYVMFFLDWKRSGNHETLDKIMRHNPEGLPVLIPTWTTTPWTLPGNVALAVHPGANYVLVENKSQGRRQALILGKELLPSVLQREYKILTELKGQELIGLRYRPLFVELSAYDKGYRVIGGDFVSLTEGTGIVHIAPAFGEIDFEIGKLEQLPVINPVSLSGEFYGDLQTAKGEPLDVRGIFVKDADALIIESLQEAGLIYRSGRIRHTYPFCWRCDTPLLYYAKPAWYIKTTAMKDRLIAGNAEINWYPDYIKHGRFGDWLENNVDWAFSRERYWGTPLPIWQCESCGEYECVSGVDDLKAKQDVAGVEGLTDLHRPHVDQVTYSCPECGAEMRRVPEVLDCWFDSGAMPLAQWHYPLENETLLQDGRFPADFISEAIDQTRGWFYSLHALSTLLFDRPCFQNVICLGHILDSQGEKMSKSKGNVIDPWLVLSQFGADALRWHLIVSSPPGNSRRLSLELVAEPVRKFLRTLWNTYSFFIIYANIDKFDPRAAAEGYRSELDRWILSELNQLIAEVTDSLDHYDPTAAGRKIEEFSDNLSNWYVRRSRRRFWKSENDAEKQAAHATLYHCLVTVAELLAPLTPFIAEEFYQNLVCSFYPEAPESVHLADFPIADKTMIDAELSSDIRLAMKISSLGRAARSKAGIKVRQPLAQVFVKVRSSREREGLVRVASQVLDELNVKELHIVDGIPLEFLEPGLVSEGGYMVAIDTQLTPKLVDEGLAREIVHRLQMMRKQAGFDIADYIDTYYQGGPAIQRVMDGFAPYIRQETLSRTLVPGLPPSRAYVERHKIATEEVVLGVRR